jgi:ribosomal protein S18 acetylase RimI-like enzyme
VKTYTMRALREDDLPRVLEIVAAIERQTPVGLVVSPEFVRERHCGPRPGWEGEAVAWERKGMLVAVSSVWANPGAGPVRHTYLRMLIDPNERLPELGDSIVMWGEDNAITRYGAGLTMGIPTPLRLTFQVGLVARHGYRIERRFAQLGRVLADPPDTIAPPDGYLLRELDPSSDLAAWVAMHNETFAGHWGIQPMLVEERAAEVGSPHWLRDLDLVVVAPDGTLAGYSTCVRNDDEDGSIEWRIDWVGTRPAHRKRGLARALTVEMLRRVSARGGERVVLDVDVTNPTGAVELYEGLGFVVEQEFGDFRRTLS